MEGCSLKIRMLKKVFYSQICDEIAVFCTFFVFCLYFFVVKTEENI